MDATHELEVARGFLKESFSRNSLLGVSGLALGAAGTGLGIANTLRNRKDSRDMAAMREMRGAADDMLAASLYSAQGGRIAPEASAKLRTRYVKARGGFQKQFPEG